MRGGHGRGGGRRSGAPGRLPEEEVGAGEWGVAGGRRTSPKPLPSRSSWSLWSFVSNRRSGREASGFSEGAMNPVRETLGRGEPRPVSAGWARRGGSVNAEGAMWAGPRRGPQRAGEMAAPFGGVILTMPDLEACGRRARLRRRFKG